MSLKLKYLVHKPLVYRLLSGITCVLLSASYAAHAQPLGKLIESTLNTKSPFTIRIYGTEDGIPQHQIAAMIPDKTGNLLIGTANGLVQFNGQTFTDINPTAESRKILCVKMFLDPKTNILYGINNKSELFQISPVTKALSKKGNLGASFHHDSVIYVNAKKEVRISKLGSQKSRLISSLEYRGCISGIGIIGKTPFFSDSTGTYILEHSKWSKLSEEIYFKTKKNPYTGENYLLGLNGIAIYYKGKLFPQKFDGNTHNSYFTDLAFSPHNETFAASHKGLFYRNSLHTAF